MRRKRPQSQNILMRISFCSVFSFPSYHKSSRVFPRRAELRVHLDETFLAFADELPAPFARDGILRSEDLTFHRSLPSPHIEL